MTKSVYEIGGWTGHYVIFKDGKNMKRDPDVRFWFTKKKAAEKFISEQKALDKLAMANQV